MYTPLRWFFAIVSLASFVAPSHAAEPTKAVTFAAPSSGPKFSVNGITSAGKKNPMAIMSEQRDGKAVWTDWVAIGQNVFGYIVKDITATSVTVKDSAGKETVLYLVDAHTDTSTKADTPELYSKAWINSTANPMVYRMMPLPIEVYRNWRKMSAEERAEIIELYRKHGWRLIMSEVAGDTTNFAWENIYEEERREVLNANRAAFQATLNPEQLAEYQRSRTAQPIMTVKGQITPEQQKEVDERRRLSAKFQSSLSPEQKTMFEATTDFTKTKWKD